jgi:hypothetical protein
MTLSFTSDIVNQTNAGKPGVDERHVPTLILVCGIQAHEGETGQPMDIKQGLRSRGSDGPKIVWQVTPAGVESVAGLRFRAQRERARLGPSDNVAVCQLRDGAGLAVEARKWGTAANESGSTLTATMRSSRVSRALYTSPIPPLPSKDKLS